jgi:hypothetical protein
LNISPVSLQRGLTLFRALSTFSLSIKVTPPCSKALFVYFHNTVKGESSSKCLEKKPFPRGCPTTKSDLRSRFDTSGRTESVFSECLIFRSWFDTSPRTEGLMISLPPYQSELSDSVRMLLRS